MTDAEELIPITRPVLGDAEATAAGEAILSGWVTQGPQVRAFEEEFAAFVGARHACAVSSCTTALHLALLAIGLEADDEVVTVSHSYIATANSIRYCSGVPVFVDIEPATYNASARAVEAAITDRTRAILCVHQMGMPCDVEAVAEVARQNGLPLIEDAACAIGSEIRGPGGWERIGRPHGGIACFSFHPRKVITTGDGGMLTTSDAELDKQFRLLRQHAMSVPDTVRHGASQVIYESYPVVGYNYRMTDIQAAIGRQQLARLPDLLAVRRRLAESYLERLTEIPGLGLPEQPSWARSNWQSFCVRLPAGLDQRAVMQELLDQGIATRRGIMCSHREPAYQREPWQCARRRDCDCAPGSCDELRVSEEIQERAVLLPLFPQMTDAQQSRVVEALRAACAAG